MKKIIALLLVLTMVLTCFVACGKDDKDDEKKIDVVGTYTGTVDLVEFAEISGEEVPEALRSASLDAEITIKLNKDETCEIMFEFDEDAFIDVLVDAVIAAGAASEGCTEEELMAELVEELGSEEAVREYLGDMVKEEFGEEMEDVQKKGSGTYEVDGDSVFITMDDGDETTEWTISGKKLTRSEDGITVTLKRQ